MATEPKQPLKVYLSYAQKDEALKQEFDDYLVIMQDTGLISGWIERPVQRGTDWSEIIDPHLLAADLILVLISPGLLASGYCSGAEVRKAFERSEKREARIIPIILHYVNLTGYPFERVQCLPRNAQPVSSWPNRSAAWGDADQGIRYAIRDMTYSQY